MKRNLQERGVDLIQDEAYMRLAIQQAELGRGQTSPNPLVGSIVVKNDQIVGMGAHLRSGTPHAEIHALAIAGPRAEGATIYVTLEPCNHTGRTGPCTEAILKSGIRRVVIGMLDPDKQVAGRGMARLQEAGLDVVTGVLETECRGLNTAYIHHRLTNMPYVTLKMAMTLDGKIATENGDSKWITNPRSRAYGHSLRQQMDAILVGVDTVIADDPELTVRLPEIIKPSNPIRVVLDSRLRIPLTSKLLDLTEADTWIFTTEQHDSIVKKQLEAKGIKVWITGGSGRVNLSEMLTILGKEGILFLLVEGGSEIHASFLQKSLAQEVCAFIAPKILGGSDSRSAVGGKSPSLMSEAVNLEEVSIELFDDDLCVRGKVKV